MGINRMVIASATSKGIFLERDVNIVQRFYCTLSGFLPVNGESREAVQLNVLSSGVCNSIKASVEIRTQLDVERSAAEALQHCLSI